MEIAKRLTLALRCIYEVVRLYDSLFYYDIICVVILSVAKDLKVYTGFECMC